MVDGKEEKTGIRNGCGSGGKMLFMYNAHVLSLEDPNPRERGWCRRGGGKLLGNLTLFEQQRAAGSSASP